jgi:hypothetical protein
MSQLENALNRIIKCLQQLDPEYTFSLMPGFEYLSVEKAFQSLIDIYPNFAPIPDEIQELYTLTNGSYSELRSVDTQTHNILPLDEAIEETVDLYRLDFFKYKCKSLFPFARTRGNGYSCVLMGQSDSLVVFMDAKDLTGGEPAYDNIISMMQSIAINYESGAYYIGDNGFILENEGMVARTLRNENPNTIDAILRELERLAALSNNEMKEEVTIGIFNAAHRYRDERFIDPLREILSNGDYIKGSWLRNIYDAIKISPVV